jgi:hypothetical protein
MWALSQANYISISGAELQHLYFFKVLQVFLSMQPWLGNMWLAPWDPAKQDTKIS